VATVSLPR
nr:RecName: Full=Sarcoplasmic calcium-binding protein [Chionoecetes opilio]